MYGRLSRIFPGSWINLFFKVYLNPKTKIQEIATYQAYYVIAALVIFFKLFALYFHLVILLATHFVLGWQWSGWIPPNPPGTKSGPENPLFLKAECSPLDFLGSLTVWGPDLAKDLKQLSLIVLVFLHIAASSSLPAQEPRLQLVQP